MLNFLIGFQEFSQYNYNYLSKLGKKTFDPPKYIARGCYDAKVNLENAGSWFTLANFSIDVNYDEWNKTLLTLKIAKINFENQVFEFDPSYLLKINNTEYGVINLNEEEIKHLDRIPYDSINDSIDFKVVKTPISNRTFIIGGKTSKTIKEIYKEDKAKIKVNYLCFKIIRMLMFYWNKLKITKTNLNIR